MKRITANSYVFDEKVDVLFCPEKSRTQQHLKEEVDINAIVARAIKTGVLQDPAGINRRQAVFGDFSDVNTFHSSLNRINAAKDAFMELPADVRKRFAHDPGELVKFLANPANKAEAIELGLIEKPKEVLPVVNPTPQA